MIWRLLLIFATALAPAAWAQYTSSTFAGSAPPNGVAATSLPLSSVFGVAVDTAGNVYISSFEQNRVFKVTTGGVISTVDIGIFGQFAGHQRAAFGSQGHRGG